PRLRSLVRGRGVLFAQPGPGTLAVPISLGWNEFQGQTSSQHRYDLRRARRRAEESGPVTTRIYTPAPDDVAALLSDFARVEASGWKARNGSSLSQRETLRQFFLNYARRASHAGAVRFAFLEVDGRSIAAQLSVVYAERLWVLKMGYDEAFSRCSPGLLLLADTMRDAFDHQLKSYEFLGIDEPWLHRWNPEVRSFSTVACYPPTFLGLCGLAADTAGRATSKAGTLLAGFDRRRLAARIGLRPGR
ncbi:MAG: GNAT family N-acetyltransferase, partial [Acidobacteriota bacterium]